MSKKNIKTPLAAAVGAAFATSLAGASIANAADNPFSMTELSNGYQVADAKAKDGTCGEGKCGAKKASTADEHMQKEMGEGKCGTSEMGKGKEGKCGAMGEEKKTKEGKCGGNK